MERDLANKKDEYLRSYCRQEYLNIYALKKAVKDAEWDLRGKEAIYESQVLLDKILCSPGSEKYKVPQSEYDKVEKIKADLKEAEDILKEKKKEGRRSDGYRRIGLIDKPVVDGEVNKLWYKSCLDGLSEETLKLSKEVLQYISGHSTVSELYILIYMEKMWGLLVDGKTVGVVDKDDKVVKSFISSVNKDLKSKPEVIVLPSMGKDFFFKDYVACYDTYENFAKVFRNRFGVSIKFWLKG